MWGLAVQVGWAVPVSYLYIYPTNDCGPPTYVPVLLTYFTQQDTFHVRPFVSFMTSFSLMAAFLTLYSVYSFAVFLYTSHVSDITWCWPSTAGHLA